MEPCFEDLLISNLLEIKKQYQAETLDDIDLDEKDKQILYHLSKGTKNKDLEKYIRLSPSSIENRKRHLKTLFGTENENDLALILAAKNRGFI